MMGAVKQPNEEYSIRSTKKDWMKQGKFSDSTFVSQERAEGRRGNGGLDDSLAVLRSAELILA